MLLVEFQRDVTIQCVHQVECAALCLSVAKYKLKPLQDALHMALQEFPKNGMLAEVSPEEADEAGHVRLGAPELGYQKAGKEVPVEGLHTRRRVQQQAQDLEGVGQEVRHVPLQDLAEARQQRRLDRVRLARHADLDDRGDGLEQVVVEHGVCGIRRHSNQDRRQWGQRGQPRLCSLLLQEGKYPRDSAHQVLVVGDALVPCYDLEHRLHHRQEAAPH
mmetsp:Transcript_55561/g.157797  ORF Transcript_55561/g.157797 Transcript_55561/m.157797 type:complete len:218 (+) Transcript_55561:919-1572(+)